ncbi:aldo/keto reductase [Bacillus sp. ISL-46]|uniref:aldo/keto reductase n=1 Tax=Bacillus sp. ISL-46 TaxID=2819129 RepID=UPI001BE62894|nr:aldo/keto reductase [Bacillus sp. ISL-46]MBT2725317.1 aldo/keto reductase [Bacillus sp. ISL-46]
MEFTTLSNGVKMPMVGFGVYQVPDAAQCERVVLDAFHAGYRLVDTAEAYMNEEAVGIALKKSGLKREDVFMTSKIWISNFGYEKTKKAYEAALKRLDMEYMDLILLHQSLSDYYSAWRALEELYKEGKVRSIGVSNFYPERLTDLCMNAEIKPMINQIECHPFFQRETDLECAKHFGVKLEAWAPFAEAGRGIFTNDVLTKIAANHEKTVAQVILRWNVQRGVVVIPKSVHRNRIEENINIFDFELSDDEMKQIATLDTGHTEIIDHYDWKIAKMLNEVKGRELGGNSKWK